MNLRAMPAVTYVTSRASHAGLLKGDRSNQKRYPGPPGWELEHEADNLIPEKKIVRKPWMTVSEISDGSGWWKKAQDRDSWKAVIKEAKTHKGL
jgi:hypothetical protein